MTFSHVVGVLSVGVRMVVRVYVANNLHMNKVKMAAMMMGKMTMRMTLRMNGWHGRMMKMEMLGKVEVVVSKDLVGKVEVEVVSKVEVEVVSKLVMALMGEMLVAMAMEEAMAEAMVWVGGRAMTTMAIMVGVIVEVVVEVVVAVEAPSASSNRVWTLPPRNS